MSTTANLTHRTISSIRPSASPNPRASSPHTPTSRVLSSSFASPSALRAEEETIVIEIGARYLRIGYAGEANPQAVISFGPEQQRRAGDYRQWDSEYDKSWRKRQIGCKEWGEKHQLWKFDLRDLDLGLVGDKLAKAVREAYSKLVAVKILNINILMGVIDIFSSILGREEWYWFFHPLCHCLFFQQF